MLKSPSIPTRRAALAVAVSMAVLVGTLTACTTAEPVEPAQTLQEGGEITIGAEAEPDCVDWISICAGSIWGNYILMVETIPSVFKTRLIDGEWTPVASDLVTGEPEAVIEGGKQVITYSINPDAVWSDGTPITSADFAYSALQIRDGVDIFDKTGYNLIESVDASDPQIAVVTLNTVYAAWRTLFSQFGLLPSHILEGQDRAAAMVDGYDFSGGPWKLGSWVRGTSMTLVPNENYWGEKPHLDKVTFLFLPDTTAAFQALKSGEVDALYPTPQVDAISQIDSGLTGITSQVDANSGSVEAIWFNNQAFPFDSTAVRKAVAYSIDRQAIVSRLFGELGVDKPLQSMNSPIVGAFAGDDFSQYSLDLDKVTELMEGDGWTRNGDGIWAKDGKTASFTILIWAGNKRRELTAQVLQSQLKDAGIEMSIQATTPAEAYSTLVPNGDYQAGLWSIIDTFPTPSLSASFVSTNIPSEANDFSGINFVRADIPGLDELLLKVDTELDTDARIAASLAADEIIADNVPALPLQTVPNVLLWSDELGGPIEINAVEGPFWNLEAWGLVG